MPYRMIVSDLDRTLLRPDRSCSEYTLDVLRALRARGIRFMIATARPIRSARLVIGEEEWDAAAWHNGALVKDLKGEMHLNAVRDAGELLRHLCTRFLGIGAAAEAEDRLYADFDAEEIWPGVEYTRVRDFTFLDRRPAEKLILRAKTAAEVDRIRAELPEGLHAVASENVIAMVMDASASKENAIRIAAEAEGIRPEEIIAFGDDYNDTGMLAFCGKGIAVENAQPEVLAVADEVCLSNAEDGPARWLERFFSLGMPWKDEHTVRSGRRF